MSDMVNVKEFCHSELVSESIFKNFSKMLKQVQHDKQR